MTCDKKYLEAMSPTFEGGKQKPKLLKPKVSEASKSQKYEIETQETKRPEMV
jgi:hypothetical protein